MVNKQFGLGVFIFFFNKNFSKILLLKRNKEKREKWGADWGNIGGKIEFGETSIQACLREIKEEIGINLNQELLKLLFVKETPDFLKTIHGLHFVYATIFNEESIIQINSESDSYGWFELDNLPNNMIDSREEILHIAKLAREHFKNE